MPTVDIAVQKVPDRQVEQLGEFLPAGPAEQLNTMAQTNGWLSFQCTCYGNLFLPDNQCLSPSVKATAAVDLEAWRRRSFPVVLARRAETQ